MRPPHHLAVLALALGVLSPGAPHAQALPSGFADSVVVQGLDLPTAFDFLPDGRVVVVEQSSGKIRLVVNGQLASVDPVVTVPAVSTGGERGLLGIAVDPQFPARPYFYTHNTSTDGYIHVSRWTVTGDLGNTGDGALSIDPASRFDLLARLADNAPNHNGGTVAFGPDGRLYVSLGDDAVSCAAQDLTALQGKILRLNVDGLPPGPGTASFSQLTPPDNPYVASADTAERLVYAYGLRNPFRFQIDPVRQCLVIGDVGEVTWEEIDLLGLPGVSATDVAPAGSNFGWPWREGPMAYLTCGPTEPASVPPIYAYNRSGMGATAIIGGPLYRATPGKRNFPARYEGDLFFGEYYSGNLYRLTRDDATATWDIAPPESGQSNPAFWASGFTNVSDWRMGPDGALWACRQYSGSFSNTGRIERIQYAGTASVPPGVTRPGLRLSVYPVPARDLVTLTCESDAVRSPRLAVYDLNGRVVRELPVPATLPAAGTARVTWNGRDGDGRRVPNGIYFARLVDGSSDARAAIVIAR